MQQAITEPMLTQFCHHTASPGYDESRGKPICIDEQIFYQSNSSLSYICTPVNYLLHSMLCIIIEHIFLSIINIIMQSEWCEIVTVGVLVHVVRNIVDYTTSSLI